MLETLLESRSPGRRSTGGAIVSVAAHTALIAAAVYATAEARVKPRNAPDSLRPVYLPAVPVVRPVAPHAPLKQSRVAADVPRRLPVIESIDIDLPPVPEIRITPAGSSDFQSRPAAGSGTESVSAVGGGGGSPYNAAQVEKQVEPAPGNLAPRYPDALRSAGVEGEVVAQFVVDEAGRVEEGSVRFVRGGNVLFEDAVRSALGRMRFIAAEVGGRKVRQLVQMPFVFTLSR